MTETFAIPVKRFSWRKTEFGAHGLQKFNRACELAPGRGRCIEHEQVDVERPGRLQANRGDLRAHRVGAEPDCGERTEPAGVGYRSDHFRR